MLLPRIAAHLELSRQFHFTELAIRAVANLDPVEMLQFICWDEEHGEKLAQMENRKRNISIRRLKLNLECSYIAILIITYIKHFNP